MADISKINDVVKLAEAFINIESITGNECKMGFAVESWLKARNWTVEKQVYSTEPLRFNILAYPQGMKDPCNNIKILVSSHIDTVGPFIAASYSNNNSILNGRGACDTKSIIASQLIAVNELFDKYNIRNIGLLYVIGEELDHCGMKYANQLNLHPQFFINGEPTESKTVIAQKGALKFNLISSGKAAHSSLPHLGLDAFEPILKIIYHLKVIETWPKSKEIGNTTLNIGKINGGTAANTIPSSTSASLYFRTATNAFNIEKRVKEIIKLYDTKKQIKYELLCISNLAIYDAISDEFNPCIVGFNTDIPLFDGYKNNELKATVLFGPGSITVAHSDNEHILINELRESVPKYQTIIRKLIKGDYIKRSKL